GSVDTGLDRSDTTHQFERERRKLPALSSRSGGRPKLFGGNAGERVENRLALHGHHRINKNQLSDPLRYRRGYAFDHHAAIAEPDENDYLRGLLLDESDDLLHVGRDV